MKNENGYLSEEDLMREILNELRAIRKEFKNRQSVPGALKDIIDNADLMRLFKINANTALRWRNNGTLPYSKVRGKIFYRISDVEKLVKPAQDKNPQ